MDNSFHIVFLFQTQSHVFTLAYATAWKVENHNINTFLSKVLDDLQGIITTSSVSVAIDDTVI